MTETAHVSSFRRVTPGIVASARLAMSNDVPDTSKSEMALLLKRAAPIFGIDGTTYHVLDILLGLSRAEDWKGAGHPIVAISNAKLAEYTMRSERTVIRCLRRLVEAGIASYRDSSSGRRFIYRGESGEIISGFGIDFTPARVRIEEIRRSVEDYRIRLNEEMAAKRDIARQARAIEDICLAFPEVAADLRPQLQTALTNPSDITTKARAICDLHNKAVEQVSDLYNAKMTSEGDMNVTSNTNTTPESYSESRKQRTGSNEPDKASKSAGIAGKSAFEKKPAAAATVSQVQTEPVGGKDPDLIAAEVLGSVSIGLLQAACRETQSMTGTHIDSWSSLARSGEIFRRMIGLSEAGWLDGRNKVGIHAASAILATVVEKSIRDPDQISKPGGYFRAMIDRALAGKLNLERSLFGLADSGYGG
ncbi:plasmid replication protein RepC [Neorhizobium alkalisoli]|uniref:Replication initiation protein RepC n=1 Tax=Neorhizobium alkalisoli TaxID=528178 RepID=A0A561QB56_9HYPH|nr:plasmid replication protein RepC [Neorhizobium alkalisoli]TWF47594.1 replication initiation protein RepC [Neorhizobium alkalisoli]